MRLKLITLVLICAITAVTGCNQATAPAQDPENIYSQVGSSPSEAVEDSLFILWEYGGALRERELAKRVFQRTEDADVRALAVLVRDGHQAGMDAMQGPAKALGLILPTQPTVAELTAIDVAARLPVKEFDRFFLRRQRAMHAWDVTVFDDFRHAASNPHLREYVQSTREPLRQHAAIVDRVARAKGVTRSGP